MWIRNSEYSRIFKASHLIKVKSRDPNHMIDYQRVITQGSLMPVIYDVIALQSKMLSFSNRIPTVKLKIPGKEFLKSETRISVTFEL